MRGRRHRVPMRGGRVFGCILRGGSKRGVCGKRSVPPDRNRLVVYSGRLRYGSGDPLCHRRLSEPKNLAGGASRADSGLRWHFWADPDLCRGTAEEERTKRLGYDAPSGVGMVIIGWLYGEGDFGKSICIAANCGDDADCTAGTLAATLGIIRGNSGWTAGGWSRWADLLRRCA